VFLNSSFGKTNYEAQIMEHELDELHERAF